MNNFLDNLRPLVLKRVDEIQLEERVTPSPKINFLDIFTQGKPAIIAEIKFASPSRGKIYKGNLDHIAIAGNYLENGASALSVLTEPYYFNGNIKFIKDIRNAYPYSNILLKDFVLDEKQIIQGKQCGANAVLLIAAFLNFNQLKKLYHFTLEQELTPLIEIHNSDELNSILDLNPKLIGVNNRNLQSLNIDLSISRNLINQIPNSTYSVCESGIDSSIKVQEMLALGFNGFLIGSSLMQSPKPGTALKTILNEFANEN